MCWLALRRPPLVEMIRDGRVFGVPNENILGDRSDNDPLQLCAACVAATGSEMCLRRLVR
ncbi:hypothetical protein DIJ64_11585 [Mycobacterium leprae]|uniref:Uncharacterized protein n=1 Tax=Mycobacterium leprae TaxID=1769 RepID=A0AAD2JEC8_MYCLR|nr:hypothetical protein DIJ64_11585 [Mycobacterium leprae]OAR21363.1 hypothetical protein A8144_06645 [Mycobacterium leprae 3125609]OAX71499.1 hypothetical protein A3216_05220 [Mycobacterium leprae 7935681]